MYVRFASHLFTHPSIWLAALLYLIQTLYLSRKSSAPARPTCAPKPYSSLNTGESDANSGEPMNGTLLGPASGTGTGIGSGMSVGEDAACSKSCIFGEVVEVTRE